MEHKSPRIPCWGPLQSDLPDTQKEFEFVPDIAVSK